VFLLLETFINEIEKMFNSFWWDHSNINFRGLHWLSWECLTTPRVLGGMEFMNLKAIKLTMVGKQTWKLILKSNGLITWLLKTKYSPLGDYFSSGLGHNPGYVWRGFQSAKDVLRCGFKCSIGSGTNIPSWNRPWLSDAYCISPVFHSN